MTHEICIAATAAAAAKQSAIIQIDNNSVGLTMIYDFGVNNNLWKMNAIN